MDLTTLADVKDWLSISQDDTGNDRKLLSLIHSLSGQCSTYLMRELGFQTYTDVRDGSGTDTIILNNWPVLQILSVKQRGAYIPASLKNGDNQSYGWQLSAYEGYPPGYPQTLRLLGGRWGEGQIEVSYTAGYVIQGERATVLASGDGYTALSPQGLWTADIGVVDYDTGLAYEAVSGSPEENQYSVAEGVYTFSQADVGKSVLISYSYVPYAIAHAVTEWVGERFAYSGRIGQTSRSLAGQETVAFDNSALPDFIKRALAPYISVLTQL